MTILSPPPFFLSWIKQTAKFYHSSRTSLYILTTCFSPVTRFHRTNHFGTGMNGQIGINIKQFLIIRFVDMQILTRCTFPPPFFYLPRLQRSNRSPGPGPQTGGRHSPANAVTSMVSMNSLPDCVIKVPWWKCSFFCSCPHPLHPHLLFVKCMQQKIRAEMNRLV